MAMKMLVLFKISKIKGLWIIEKQKKNLWIGTSKKIDFFFELQFPKTIIKTITNLAPVNF
jgi:hypothetical protein